MELSAIPLKSPGDQPCFLSLATCQNGEEHSPRKWGICSPNERMLCHDTSRCFWKNLIGRKENKLWNLKCKYSWADGEQVFPDSLQSRSVQSRCNPWPSCIAKSGYWWHPFESAKALAEEKTYLPGRLSPPHCNSAAFRRFQLNKITLKWAVTIIN